MQYEPELYTVDSAGRLVRNPKPLSILPAGHDRDVIDAVKATAARVKVAVEGEAEFHNRVRDTIRANPGMRADAAEAVVRARTAKPLDRPSFDPGANRDIDLAEVARING